MSHDDSLVVVVVDEGQGGWEQHTNELLWLVDGCGGRRRAGRATMTHQWVMMTRWWSWWLTRDGDEEKDPPTSHCDLLLVVAVDKGQRGREQHTNESLWLIGGCGGWQRAGRVTMTHQQVIMTCWWSWWLTMIRLPMGERWNRQALRRGRGASWLSFHCNKKSRDRTEISSKKISTCEEDGC